MIGSLDLGLIRNGPIGVLFRRLESLGDKAVAVHDQLGHPAQQALGQRVLTDKM